MQVNESNYPPPIGQTKAVSETYRRFVLFMMLLVAALNFVDRQLMAILLNPIREEFGFNDTELGFLSGFAFAIAFAITGLPLARLADTGNRRNLIAGVVAFWSAMTALCGAATGYVSLLLARMGVGAGEAGSSPAIQSMIGDYYPPKKRASAISTQMIGVYGGILLGFLFGGWLSETFGWRMAFLVMGLPGIAFALLFWLTVKEPARGQSENLVVQPTPPTMRETMRHLWRSPACRLIPLAAAFHTFASQGSMSWAPSFFTRTHHMTQTEVGAWLALCAGLAGGLGCYFGGIVTERIANRTNDERWYLWVPAICLAATIPAQFVIYLSPTPVPALIVSALVWFLSNTWLGPVLATLQGLAGARRRAMAVAIVLFANNLVGMGLGAQFVGLMSDLLRDRHGEDSLRYALLIGVCIASALSAIAFFVATRTLREDLHRSRAEAA